MSDTPLIRLEGVWRAGDLCGKVHCFKMGDGLPVHAHEEERNHITIVLRGRFVLIGRPAIEGKIIAAGEAFDWVAGEPHGFIALEDDSSFIQIQRSR
jgi:quercetin dioxygenase-like cupin family protein